MADGALNTVFTKKEFDKISKALEGIKTQEKKCRCSWTS
jgi:hypothetical protein